MGAFRTFESEMRGERSADRLRLVSAVLVSIGSVWMLVIAQNPATIIVSFLALFAAIAWVVRWARSERRVAGGARAVLALTREELRLSLPGVEPRVIPWGEVRGVDVDHDLLRVRVLLREGEPLIVEPVFDGVAIDDLAEAIHAAHVAGLAARSG